MTETVHPHLLDAVWEYPLFDALYGRRTRRFGLGFEMAQGPSRYKSPHAPLPLTEGEEALLVAAGVGFSGMALWDQSRPMPYRSADGRTFPSTSRGRRRRCSSPMIAGSMSSTRTPARPATLEKPAREMDGPKRSVCTAITASLCRTTGWRFHVVRRRSADTISGTRICPARHCSFRSAMSAFR